MFGFLAGDFPSAEASAKAGHPICYAPMLGAHKLDGPDSANAGQVIRGRSCKKMNYTIRQMALTDYDQAYELWRATEGVYLDEEDSREGITLYLRRNHGLCFVATVGARLVGTVLCGHEGRRGILRHLVVAPEYRTQGIATDLINHVRSALAKEGIRKCNTFVLDSNLDGRKFWEHMGWHRLDDDFQLLQINTGNTD